MTLKKPFWRRFWLALAAVIAGNSIYFALARFLPINARHTEFQIVLGLVVDFWICVMIYNLLLSFFASRH
jgi:hypothetical protein